MTTISETEPTTQFLETAAAEAEAALSKETAALGKVDADLAALAQQRAATIQALETARADAYLGLGSVQALDQQRARLAELDRNAAELGEVRATLEHRASRASAEAQRASQALDAARLREQHEALRLQLDERMRAAAAGAARLLVEFSDFENNVDGLDETIAEFSQISERTPEDAVRQKTASDLGWAIIGRAIDLGRRAAELGRALGIRQAGAMSVELRRPWTGEFKKPVPAWLEEQVSAERQRREHKGRGGVRPGAGRPRKGIENQSEG